MCQRLRHVLIGGPQLVGARLRQLVQRVLVPATGEEGGSVVCERVLVPARRAHMMSESALLSRAHARVEEVNVHVVTKGPREYLSQARARDEGVSAV